MKAIFKIIALFRIITLLFFSGLGPSALAELSSIHIGGPQDIKQVIVLAAANPVDTTGTAPMVLNEGMMAATPVTLVPEFSTDEYEEDSVSQIFTSYEKQQTEDAELFEEPVTIEDSSMGHAELGEIILEEPPQS